MRTRWLVALSVSATPFSSPFLLQFIQPPSHISDMPHFLLFFEVSRFVGSFSLQPSLTNSSTTLRNVESQSNRTSFSYSPLIRSFRADSPNTPYALPTVSRCSSSGLKARKRQSLSIILIITSNSLTPGYFDLMGRMIAVT